jgi:carbon storage regulator CsrA
VLTRHPGEQIILTLPDGRQVEILVIDSHGKVRLGINAPRDVRINRKEIEERIANPGNNLDWVNRGGGL